MGQIYDPTNFCTFSPEFFYRKIYYCLSLKSIGFSLHLHTIFFWTPFQYAGLPWCFLFKMLYFLVPTHLILYELITPTVFIPEYKLKKKKTVWRRLILLIFLHLPVGNCKEAVWWKIVEYIQCVTDPTAVMWIE